MCVHTLVLTNVYGAFSPFLSIKRWHAINIIRTGGENTRPFIAKMSAPPSVV